MRRVALLPGLTAALLVVASQVSAAPTNTNCPNGTEWARTSVDTAAATIWPFLVDQSPWPGGEEEFQQSAVAPHDKNGDSLVCLKRNQQSNPNGNWYEAPLFLLRDNSSNAS